MFKSAAGAPHVNDVVTLHVPAVCCKLFSRKSFCSPAPPMLFTASVYLQSTQHPALSHITRPQHACFSNTPTAEQPSCIPAGPSLQDIF